MRKKLFILMAGITFTTALYGMEEEKQPYSEEKDCEHGLCIQTNKLVDTGFQVITNSFQVLSEILHNSLEAHASNSGFDQKDTQDLLQVTKKFYNKAGKQVGLDDFDTLKASSCFAGLCYISHRIEILHEEKFTTDGDLATMYRALGKAARIYGIAKYIKRIEEEARPQPQSIYVENENIGKIPIDISYEDLVKIMQNNFKILSESSQQLEDVFKTVLGQDKPCVEMAQAQIEALTTLKDFCNEQSTTDDPNIQNIKHSCIALFVISANINILHEQENPLINDQVLDTVYMALGKAAASPLADANYLKSILKRNLTKIEIIPINVKKTEEKEQKEDSTEEETKPAKKEQKKTSRRCIMM